MKNIHNEIQQQNGQKFPMSVYKELQTVVSIRF